MGHPFLIAQYVNPFDGLADASHLTSNVIDTRDAFDITLSYRTTSGTTTTFTYQVSNAHKQDDIAAASWSTYTSYVFTASGTSSMEPPLGYRYARVIKVDGSASSTPGTSAALTVEINKMVR